MDRKTLIRWLEDWSDYDAKIFVKEYPANKKLGTKRCFSLLMIDKDGGTSEVEIPLDKITDTSFPILRNSNACKDFLRTHGGICVECPSFDKCAKDIAKLATKVVLKGTVFDDKYLASK